MNNQRLKTSIPVAVCFVILALFGIESLRVGASKRRPGENEVAFQPTYSASINAIARRTNGLVFHAPSQRIYASVPSGSDSIGNSIAKIDPTTGVIEQSVWVGSEPNRLALADDGNTLYVSLDGARAIRKFDLTTGTAGLQFQAGLTNYDGPLRVVDIAVSPSNPNVVAVSRSAEASSSAKGVAIFENGVQRTNTGGSSGYLAFSDSESVLFGNAYYGSNLERLTVDASGVTAVTSTSASTNYSDLFVDGTRLYTSIGRIFEVATGNLLGTFPVSDAYTTVRPFVIDSANNKAIYVARTSTGLKIQSFDTRTFVLLGAIDFPGMYAEPKDVARWGTNGLAISTANDLTYFIQSDLVGAGPIPPSVPTPTTTPTPISPVFVRRVNIATNDILYNESEGKIYASIPGVAGPGLGNTISRLDPATGTLISSVFIGSEPHKLALSNDGSSLYASLTGASAIRRFDTATQTAGLQFTPANNNYPTRDIVVLPGNPQSVAVSSGDGGVAVYDNGVKRPTAPSIWAGPIEQSGTANLIYAYNDVSTGFNLYKLAVGTNGLSVVSNVQNLIYRFNVDMLYDSGRLYCGDGRVVDPETSRILGIFNSNNSSYSVAVDSGLGRAFILKGNSIEVFDTNTFNKVGTIFYPFEFNSTTPSSLIRWGSNGLAFRTSPSQGEGYIYLIQSPLVSPNGTLPIGYNLEASAKTVSEAASSVTINIIRTGDLSTTTSVDYATSDGTATAGNDYTQVNGTMTFGPGELSKAILVPIVNDNVYEGNETFSLTLGNPTGNNSTITYPSSSLITITDNEYPPSVSGTSVTATEPVNGQTTIAQVAVNLSNPSTQTITVNYATVNGTAQAGSDYLAVNGSLTFSPLETAKVIPITILGDGIVESNETFSLSLIPTGSTSGVLYPLPKVTILDYVPYHGAPFDFDGDGKTDPSIFRPGPGEWWWLRSSNGGNGAVQFGVSTDNIAAADYTGDGKTDVAFWRPSTGQWFVLRSEDFSFYAVPFGTNGDVPVPADYDGDGKADAAVFRESSLTWYISKSSGGTDIVGFGAAGDKPVNADYDGDGKSDIAIFRPNGANGAEWWIRQSSNATVFATQFGSSTDRAVPADYTGDGKADIAFWTPSSGNWFVLRSEDYSYFAFPFGSPSDIPTPGDYDGDGKTDAAVFRPSSSTWYAQRSTAGLMIQRFGAAGDVPVPSAFVR